MCFSHKNLWLKVAPTVKSEMSSQMCAFILAGQLIVTWHSKNWSSTLGRLALFFFGRFEKWMSSWDVSQRSLFEFSLLHSSKLAFNVPSRIFLVFQSEAQKYRPGPQNVSYTKVLLKSLVRVHATNSPTLFCLFTAGTSSLAVETAVVIARLAVSDLSVSFDTR